MNTPYSDNYSWDWWLEDNIKVYSENPDSGFVDGTWYTNADCEQTWWNWDNERHRSTERYNFFKHPLVIQEKIQQALFNSNIDSTTLPKKESIPISGIPNATGPKWKVSKGEVLIELLNGHQYVYIRLFWEVVSLWKVSKEKTLWKWWSKVWRHNKSVVQRYSLDNNITWKTVWIWNNENEAAVHLFTQISIILHKISPKDYPHDQSKEEKLTSIEWTIDDIKYTLIKIEDTGNAWLEFECHQKKYVTFNIKSQILWKRKIYFLCPEWAEKSTQNIFRKRIWAEGKNYEEATKKMLRSISRVLSWNKSIDKGVLTYLESIRK